MNVLILNNGVSQRFTNEGYNHNKCLIRVLGQYMIFYVIDNLKITPSDTITIVYNSDLDKAGFSDIIKHQYPKIKLIALDKHTRGAAETALLGLQQFSEHKLKEKIMTVDCDTFYEYDILSKFRTQTDNAVFCFIDALDNPIYSYVKTNSKSIITEIKEKEKISNYANTGAYCFESGLILKKYCEIALKEFEEKQNTKELYMSGVISRMIQDKHIFRANIISEDDFHCVGTPFQLKLFCIEHCKKYLKPMRICFDLDNTLVTYPEVPNDYTTVKPIIKTINMCQYLKGLGHTIIIYTARRMKTHNNNVGACVADIGKITFETLEKFGIPYDEIIFGKPYFDVLIDDLAIDPHQDLERELGFYNATVGERTFNQIIKKSDNIVIKKGQNNKIKGEIHWYNNIPSSIKQLFPIMYSSNIMSDSYDMERIIGITLSSLYVTESMSTKMLEKYLDSIEEIHNSLTCCATPEFDMYANYCDKIKERYSKYDYSKFNGASETYNKLVEYFENYKQGDYGLMSVIHGDPVFSNCIVNEYGQFKFIDMRGLQGDKETIFGDKWYDYGKIYQSLTGYDEILLDKTLSIDYKTEMMKIFCDFVCRKFGNDALMKIKMISNSLLFTLIPLHNNDKCIKYYDLIKF